ncbi:unnamed protein product, partial [Discosporangium mesarthrocarpum]
WCGQKNLNAIESDLQYKYHVVHLNEVIRGRSKLDNKLPRTVETPPPWATVDPSLLSPIPNAKEREARWNQKFFLERSLDGQDTKKRLDCRPRPRQRPASAGVRKLPDEARFRERPSSATLRGTGALHRQVVTERPGGHFGFQERKGIYRKGNSDHLEGARKNDRVADDGLEWQGEQDLEGLSKEELDILKGTYTLNEEQDLTYRRFTRMLIDFDTCTMIRILEDAFQDAQDATMLADFTGCS